MSLQETDTTVTLTHPEFKNTSVTVLKYGATVYSWRLNGTEKLWLSKDAKLDGSKPVRGGIPLVFPAFGKNTTDEFLKDLPQHGFARNSNWKFNGLVRSYPPTIQFELNETLANKELIKVWPFKFTIKYNIELGYDHLNTHVDIVNNETSGKAFQFNWLFHTYYQISDIGNIHAVNLQNVKTHDNLTGKDATETQSQISINSEVDKRYLNVCSKREIKITGKSGAVAHNIIRKNLPDVVVWNPWIEKSKGMADFTPKDGYKKMLCIEPGHIHDLVTLKPNEKWSASQIIY